MRLYLGEPTFKWKIISEDTLDTLLIYPLNKCKNIALDQNPEFNDSNSSAQKPPS